MEKKNPIQNLKLNSKQNSKEIPKTETSVFEEQIQKSEEVPDIPPVFPSNNEDGREEDPKLEMFKCGRETVCQSCSIMKELTDIQRAERLSKENETDSRKVTPVDKKGEASYIPHTTGGEDFTPPKEKGDDQKTMKTIYHTIPNSGRKDY